MIIKNNAYRKSYENLEKLQILKKDFIEVINIVYSPVNYLFGYPKNLNTNISSALEKKLTGRAALKAVEEGIIYYPIN